MNLHRQPGYTLARPFYHDQTVYQTELDSIWRKQWLFAGHTCQIPNPGDYFIYSLDTDSIIIARQEDGSVAAFHNICRHRGSQIIDDPQGHVRSFMCPYHQWTYRLDGSLLQCREMPADTDKDSLGLHTVSVAGHPCLYGAFGRCRSHPPKPDYRIIWLAGLIAFHRFHPRL